MKKIAILVIILLICFFTLNAETTPGKKYNNDSFARLSYVTGNTYIQRASEIGYEEGVVNMPIVEGDRIGTTEGKAEIYVGNGNYIRLDHNTKIDFLNLPTPENELIRVQIWTGNVYFSIESLKQEKNIQIYTNDVSGYILDGGVYRFDIQKNEKTSIYVFEGLLEAAGETGSTLLQSAQKLEVVGGKVSSHPTQFLAVAEDSFDRWSENRDSQLRQQLAQEYLPRELDDYEHELAVYGDWVYIPPYGNVWVPGGVDRGWRPYYYGRWTWLSLCGWTWVPYEPWGWVTHHYGRWHWSPVYGWYWIPTSIWGPAWVSWYWGYDYFAWAPMTYYGYPAVIINNVFYDHYRGYYPYNSPALTVIHKSQLQAPNVSKVALSRDSLTNVTEINKINLSSESRTIKPHVNKINLEKLQKNNILLQKEGNLSGTKEVGRVPQTTIRKINSSGMRKMEKGSTGSQKIEERKILMRKYPSSFQINLRKSNLKKSTSNHSNSVLGRIYKYFSGKNEYIKPHSSTKYIRRNPSKSIITKSIRKNISSKHSSRSTVHRSSSSSSGKVKKKDK